MWDLKPDLTPFLRHDGENVGSCRALTGPKRKVHAGTREAGSFRDVYLQVQNPTHIARHGVYITTPRFPSSRER